LSEKVSPLHSIPQHRLLTTGYKMATRGNPDAIDACLPQKCEVTFESRSTCSVMKASDGLSVGLLMLVLAACLFVLQGVFVRVNTVSSPLSTHSLTTYPVYECGPILGTRPCAIVYYVATSAAGLFSSVSYSSSRAMIGYPKWVTKSGRLGKCCDDSCDTTESMPSPLFAYCKSRSSLPS